MLAEIAILLIKEMAPPLKNAIQYISFIVFGEKTAIVQASIKIIDANNKVACAEITKTGEHESQIRDVDFACTMIKKGSERRELCNLLSVVDKAMRHITAETCQLKPDNDVFWAILSLAKTTTQDVCRKY